MYSLGSSLNSKLGAHIHLLAHGSFKVQKSRNIEVGSIYWKYLSYQVITILPGLIQRIEIEIMIITENMSSILTRLYKGTNLSAGYGYYCTGAPPLFTYACALDGDAA